MCLVVNEQFTQTIFKVHSVAYLNVSNIRIRHVPTVTNLKNVLCYKF